MLWMFTAIQNNQHLIKCHSYFDSVHNLHAGVTEDRKLRNTAMGWPVVACSVFLSSFMKICLLVRDLLRGSRIRTMMVPEHRIRKDACWEPEYKKCSLKIYRDLCDAV